MKTIKNILFGAMTLASLAGIAQTNIQYGTSNYNPDKVHLDSISDTYRDAVLKEYIPNETRYSEVDVLKNISYDTIYSYDMDSKKMNPSMISEVQYNSNNKIATAITKYWDSESLQWFVYSVDKFEYDTLGNITYYENSLRESPELALTPQYKIETIYDSYNRPIQRFNFQWINNQWEMSQSEKSEFETDARNNITKVQSYIYSNNEWIETTSSSTTYTYNKDGYILTQQTEFLGSCTNLVTNVYDENNNIIQKETRILKNNEWIITDSLKQKFDSKGNVIEKYTYDRVPKINEEGYFEHKDTIKTTYNDLGLVTSEYSHHLNVTTGKWYLPSTSYFTYDKYNRLVKYQETGQLIPNGAIVLFKEKEWYYKVKTESLKVTNNKLLAITFDTELAESDKIAQNIKVDLLSKTGGDFYVINAWVNESDSSSLIIEFNRPMVGGEKFTVSLNEGLKTENGRNVSFEVEMCNTATGVASFSESNINIYPTIASDKITISSDAKITSIQILTLSGTEIASFDAQNLQSLEINIDNLPSGNYIVIVKSEESIVSSKIIKQ